MRTSCLVGVRLGACTGGGCCRAEVLVVDVVQKLALWGVPPLEEVGGPAEGLTCIVTGPTRSGVGVVESSCEASLRKTDWWRLILGAQRHWAGDSSGIGQTRGSWYSCLASLAVPQRAAALLCWPVS